MFAFARAFSPEVVATLGTTALRYTGSAAAFVAGSTAAYVVGRTTLGLAHRGTAKLAAYLADNVNEPAPVGAPAPPRKPKKSDIDPVELEIARRIKAGILKQVIPAEPETAAAE
jgi:hypothetical protein